MLIRFTVSNFMSFKDETEFNMLPSKGNGSRKLQNHIHETSSGIEVLKTAAIYGANAAGKSNLVKAIDYLKRTIFGEYSTLMPQSKRFKLDRAYIDKPTTFRIEYEYRKIHFDYAIEITKGKITKEWLYRIDSVKKQNEKLLYNRKNNIVEFGDYLNNSQDLNYIKKYLKKELTDTKTVLDLCFGNIEDNDILDTIYMAFVNLSVVTPNSKSLIYSHSLLFGNQSAEFARNLLVNSKTGIKDLIINKIEADKFFSYDEEDFKKDLIDELENRIDQHSESSLLNFIPFQTSQINIFHKIDQNYYVSFLKTQHFNSEDLFDFSEESDGTNRLFELSPAFEQLITETDIVYIIDELERSMHPLLAKELLKMYSSSNSKNSQLIFTTHESHLLDNELLRRDEIWFTEKKEDGSTEFYPLSNFNPRGDKVLERGYLEGRYGGIPYLGDFSKLIIKENQD